MIDATPVTIANARVPGYSGLQRIWVDCHHRIARIEPMASPDIQVARNDSLDLEGDWLSLGGVDLQINGALGLAFPDLSIETADQLPAICDFLWDQGIDAILPTLVTTSVENITRSLSTLSHFKPQTSNFKLQTSSRIPGVHLEGPFLNPAKRGAHPAEYLLPLTLDQVNRILGDHASIVTIITLAPELDTTGDVIPYLRSLGITVSLGHSLATAAQAQAAFRQGATMVTHAFNAMPGLHHREPGLLGAALADPTAFCGLIADGQHVAPLMVDLLVRMGRGSGAFSPLQKLFLVSDALAPLGLPDGTYPWDSRQIEVTQGTARLPDGTLAGTTLPLLVGVQNLVKWGVCGVEEAIALATEAPRHAIGLPGLAPGQPANFLHWHLDPTTNTLTWQRLDSLIPKTRRW